MSDQRDANATSVESHEREMLVTFCQELNENILLLENALIELEKNPVDKDQINSTFRVFHNTKGSASMMGFQNIIEITHWCESLLDLVRNDKMRLESRHVDVLLEALTAIRKLSQSLKESGAEGNHRFFHLLAKLHDFSLENQSGKISTEEDAQHQDSELAAASAKSRASEDDMIKVSRSIIDQMLLLVSDFMLVKNRFDWIARRYPQDTELLDNCRELSIFATKLQRGIFQLRLSPVGPLFNTMNRVVRTTAAECKKKVTLEIKGGDTLIDRNILDVLNEPLLHLIRNSIDHGIESQEDRAAANKPAEGQVTLSAQYRSGEVYIGVADDGKGIHAEKIRDVALRKKLLTEQQAKSLSQTEMLNLIFLPGFSSVDVVTKISGRGVGMDVVKSAIEKIGGTVEIITEPGVGTTFGLHLPLSLAIVECLGFTVGNQALAIAQVSVEEVFSSQSTHVAQSMELLPDGHKAIILRDVTIPVLDLRQIFGVDPSKESSYILVHYGKQRFFLEVDKVSGPISIVSQAIPGVFIQKSFFSGVTKQGDGSLLFQMDLGKVASLIHHQSVVSQRKSTYMTSEGNTASAAIMTSSDMRRLQQKIITFKNVHNFCIPVQRARRIVHVNRSQIKFIRHDGPSFLELDGQTIPLLWIEELVLKQPRIVRDSYSVVIINKQGQHYGMPLAEFQGIKRMPENYDRSIAEIGISGSSVIEQQTYLVVDVNGIVDLSRTEDKATLKVSEKKRTKVLVAEDDGFFAAEMISSLKAADLETVLFKDGLEAKKALEDDSFAKSIDIVVTDIEMPNMNGISLIRWIKSMNHTRHLPCIVHTAVTSVDIRAKAAQVGAIALVSKLNSDHLLGEVERVRRGEQPTHSLSDEIAKNKEQAGRVVTFCLREHWFALPMESIKEVSPPSPSSVVPGHEPWMNRITFFRGSVIPVLDLGMLFEIGEKSATRINRFEQVVAGAKLSTFALLTDQVGDVVPIQQLTQGEGVLKFTPKSARIASCVKTSFSLGGKVVTFLDIAALEMIALKGQQEITAKERVVV